MTEPKITAIVPAYNIAEHLPRCVESLLGQSFAGLEVILVDDGSTDATGEICDRFAAQDPRVQVIHQKNGGLAAARNAGMAVAQGQYISFIDGDDYLVPGSFEELWQIVLAHRPDLVCFGFKKVRDGETLEQRLRPYGEGLYQGDSLTPLELDAISYRKVLDYSVPRVLSAWANLYCRAWLKDRGLFFRSERELLNEDYLFVLQAMWAAETVYVLPEGLYCYVTREGSLSRSPRAQMYERKRRLYAAYEATLPAGDEEVELRLRNFYIDGMYNCITEACQTMPHREAVAAIGQVLSDPFLQHCLRENCSLAESVKTRCICLLMRWRMARSVYCFYRLSKKILGK